MPKFESLEDWIEKVWKDQESLGEKVGVARNTVSQWKNGKSRIKPPMREKLKKLGYDGPWPELGQEVTRDDLEEIHRKIDFVHKDLDRKILALGASVQEVLNRLPQHQGNPGAKPS